jgi:hypothetical protein
LREQAVASQAHSETNSLPPWKDLGQIFEAREFEPKRRETAQGNALGQPVVPIAQESSKNFAQSFRPQKMKQQS